MSACVNMQTVMNMIQCPYGQVLQSRAEIVKNCAAVGIACPAGGIDATFECVCNPCKPICMQPLVYLGASDCGCPDNQLHLGGNCVELLVIIVATVVPGRRIS
jgi:hypothetical protein